MLFSSAAGCCVALPATVTAIAMLAPTTSTVKRLNPIKMARSCLARFHPSISDQTTDLNSPTDRRPSARTEGERHLLSDYSPV